MDIEALATEAGSETAWDVFRDDRGELRISLEGVEITEELLKFAILVASAEREACAKICESYDNGRESNLADLCAERIRKR
jgi:hypothetical protein